MSEAEEDFVTVTLPRRLGNMRLRKARTEGKDPLQLLPEEVWRVILHELEDWRDIRNCSNSSTLFRRIIQESKTLNAFKVHALFGRVLPHLYKYLDGAEILACRAVCTAWNKGVDDVFENDKSLRPHNDMDSDPRRPPFISLLREKGLGGLYSQTRYYPRGWTRKLRASHGRNPFIGRDVVVGSDYFDLEAYLEAYGKHIWYLTVCFPGDVDPGDANSIRLFRMVTVEQDRLFPNLRRLCIAGTRFYLLVPRRNIDWFSLPDAPHLETLQIRGAYSNFTSLPTSVELLLRKYHLQLRRLDVGLKDHLPLVSRLEWPNLTELQLDVYFPYDPIRDFEPLLRTKMPNLSKLVLEPFPGEEDWTELLEFIGKLSLSTRLSTLRIPPVALAGYCQGESTLTGDSFTAPETLKTLELDKYFSGSYDRPVYLTCYSFLRRFPFLENLNIFWRSDLDYTGNILLRRKEDSKWRRALKATQASKFFNDDDGLEVNKYLYRGEMYKSNIWEVLPRLKVLTFQMNCYTRDGYHKFRMTKQN